MATNNILFSPKYLLALALSVLCISYAGAQNPPSDSTSAPVLRGLGLGIGEFSPQGEPLLTSEFGSAVTAMELPSAPLKLLEQVEPPCVSITVNEVTLSFSKADVEEHLRLHERYSPPTAQELVEAVWATIPPSESNTLCANIPQRIEPYVFRESGTIVDLQHYIHNILTHLLEKGLATAYTSASQQPVTSIYVRSGQRYCPYCGMIPPAWVFFSLEPDTELFWQGSSHEMN